MLSKVLEKNFENYIGNQLFRLLHSIYKTNKLLVRVSVRDRCWASTVYLSMLINLNIVASIKTKFRIKQKFEYFQQANLSKTH